jgi:hypothetical protein
MGPFSDCLVEDLCSSGLVGLPVSDHPIVQLLQPPAPMGAASERDPLPQFAARASNGQVWSGLHDYLVDPRIRAVGRGDPELGD